MEERRRSARGDNPCVRAFCLGRRGIGPQISLGTRDRQELDLRLAPCWSTGSTSGPSSSYLPKQPGIGAFTSNPESTISRVNAKPSCIRPLAFY